MADLKNVEIFAVGTWNGFKFVQEDLEQIINNTNVLIEKQELRPRIKLGHSSNQILEGQSDGDPSLGTPSNFRIKDNKIISDFSNLPDIIFSAIQKERFTDVSVEMEHIKHFGWFIKAVSLLGADIPAVKTINDLQKFLADTDNESYELNENITLACSEPVLIQPNIQKDVKKMSDEKNVLQLELEKRELERKIKEMEDKSKSSEAELSKFKEADQDRKFSDEKTKILEPYRAQVKEGKLAPSIMSKLELAIDSQRSNFSDGASLMVPADMILEITTAYSDRLPQKEHADDSGEGEDTVPIDQKVLIEINKVRAQTNMNYMDAAEAVFAANPNLEKDYIGWTNKISYKEV